MHSTNLLPEEPIGMASILEPSKPNFSPAMTKIVGTLGPNSRSVDTISSGLKAGMSVARFDFSWGDLEYHQETLENLKLAIKSTKKLCAVMLDTMGPELQVVNKSESSISLEENATVVLTPDQGQEPTSHILPISFCGLAQAVKPGDTIFMGQYLFTGSETTSVRLEVSELSGDDVVCVIKNTATLSGSLFTLHASQVHIDLPTLTNSDKEVISKWGSVNKIDFLSLSYTRHAKDVRDAREFLLKFGDLQQTQIFAKIENIEGLTHFDEILSEADGIILSRGNLGIDLPPDKVFLFQKAALVKCNMAGKPVVVTRVGDSMTDNLCPTRAEATDVANAVLDGSDAILLSAEALRGLYPVENISIAGKICAEAEKVFNQDIYSKRTVKYVGKPMSHLESIASSALVTEELKKKPPEVSTEPQDSEKKNPSDMSTGSQGSGVSDYADSSSNSCESSGKNLESLEQVPEIQVPELPPSSCDIAVPEDSISHLFSVYTFLRSFSVHMFLSPFTLADFVGSLNCTVKNSLADVVHLSLMKALRRHLESLSSEGCQFASKCLRYHDWSLLDTLTWPVFLLEFLYLRSLVQELGGQSFGLSLSSGEYYGLPVSVKLKVFQILCDEVMSSTEMKSELEKREEYSEDLEYDSDGIANVAPIVPTTRRGRPRVLKTTTTTKESQEESALEKEASGSLDVGQDGNSDDCRICGMDGMLICCDGCPWAYHSRCIGLTKASLPQGKWFCHECTINKFGPTSARIERGARGACYFGIDATGRQFVGTCDYLIVTRSLPDAEPYNRYYNRSDVAKVLYVLSHTDEIVAHYSDIRRGIFMYWDGAFSGINISSGLITLTPPDASAAKNLNVHGMTIETSRGVVAKSSVRPGPAFKPYLYLNQYMHGDIAATAAATFAILSAEESNLKASDVSNPRKAVHQMMVIQMKAFSQATSQFVWPSADRRLMEVPRDRCGWCMSCKGANVNKKGCLLNWAASNAIKGSARSLSGLRPILRTEESNIPSVATYIASMEESLQGLVEGALLDANYRNWWRNQIKEANDCNILKFLLLELEKCIRGVAFSSGWFRLFDEWSLEISGTTGGAASRISSQRRGGSGAGKRGKKSSGPSESTTGASDDSWKEVHWWRGGKLSNVVFQRGLLSKKFAKKAARQGGGKKVPGISYHDSTDYPRRSRQLAWRISVQMCKSTAHLALQVRYLNSHIRWKELVPPDQFITEGKGAEADAAVFRNADICDKKMLENKTLYSLKFTNQKHLPVRVTRNVIEMEEPDGLSGKLWFSENHIPLYLIKTYEEKAKTNSLLSPTVVPTGIPIKQRKRLQAYYKNIFAYLSDRGHKGMKPPCASCKKEVLLRDVVRCISCQGDCHEKCMMLSLSVVICTSCHAKCVSQPVVPKVIQVRKPMPLPPQEIKKVKRVEQVTPITPKVKFQIGGISSTPRQAVQAVASTAAELEFKVGQKRKKPSPPTGEPICYGLRWRREGKPDTGMEFRSEHLVLKCRQGTDLSRQPVCCLCHKPYDPDHLYIRCEKCLSWFHEVSVELQESQVNELVGFKCGKCRRKVQPKCPYVEQSSKKVKIKSNKVHAIQPPVPTTQKNDSTERLPVQPFHSSDDDLMLFPDPLLSSYAKVEPLEQTQNQTSDATQLDASQLLLKSNQKLSVRRAQTKGESDLVTNSETLAVGATTPATDSEDLNDVSVSSELLSPALEWDFSEGDASFGDAIPDDNSNCAWTEANHESIGKGEGGEGEDDDSFEPQTYFSFTELLAPEDNSLLEENQLIGVTFDELLANSVQEEQPGSGFRPETEPEPQPQPQPQSHPQQQSLFEGEIVMCGKCKGYDPIPDMTCEICNLCIHNYCSPWMESEESFPIGHWKCGNCREWR